MASKKNNLFQVMKGEDLNNIMHDWHNHLVVVMFSASWCGPCKTLKPYFKKGSLDYDDVFFAYIDCDKYDDGEFNFKKGVEGYPTTKFYLNHHELVVIDTANIDKFQDDLKELQSSIKFRRAKVELDRIKEEENKKRIQEDLMKEKQQTQDQYIQTTNGPIKVTPELLARLATLNGMNDEETKQQVKQVKEDVGDDKKSVHSGTSKSSKDLEFENMVKKKAVEELAKLRQQENILKMKKLQQLKWLQQLKYKKNLEENNHKDTKSSN